MQIEGGSINLASGTGGDTDIDIVSDRWAGGGCELAVGGRRSQFVVCQVPMRRRL